MSDTVFQHIGRPVVTTAINDIPAEWAYTVPVLGVARGGTTMVATVLDRLGIYMGPRQELVGDHYENQAMKQPCWQTRADCVTNYNSKYARWGWKDTIGLPSFSELFPLIRSPRPVVVFRDIVASVQGLRYEHYWTRGSESNYVRAPSEKEKLPPIYRRELIAAARSLP
jgi:hypothetical protein